MTDEFASLATALKLSPAQVRATAELLDAGNTIPFIARFRKDLTGGLDPEQIQAVREKLATRRALDERKTFVLKSIESQGALTPELEQSIRGANNSRHVEDLYLPFKTHKQSLALTARQQGLEPLAQMILGGQSSPEEIAALALAMVRVDRGLNSVDDVMAGVRHLITDQYADHGGLRHELRQLYWKSATLACKLAPTPGAAATPVAENSAGTGAETVPSEPAAGTVESELAAATAHDHPTDAPTDAASAAHEAFAAEAVVDDEAPDDSESPDDSEASDHSDDETDDADPELEEHPDKVVAQDAATVASGSGDATVDAQVPSGANETSESGTAASPATESPAVADGLASVPAVDAVASIPQPAPSATTTPDASRKRKKKKKKPVENPFRDYENFEQPVARMPDHRVLAINRGERAGLVKARVRVNQEQVETIALAKLVPAGHPLAELLADCAREAMARHIQPSLEREVRRELTEKAESHAVEVFTHNLRALLLQPPVEGKRILAVDPGYKSGCSIAIVDPRGSLLAAERIFIVGNQARKDENRQKLARLVREHQIDVIAIGNGAACREVEQLVSDAIAKDLTDLPVRFVMVNEAGASIYSTSETGKEELPHASPGTRSAVSIARRLIDPLSEFVKISPGHLGIGLYEHDIKARHLADSLDEVVAECVNYVGVNVNTASPSLLRHVSGLNQLTARRLYDFRQSRPITNREAIREVAGIGDATFVQAAGFLRVYNGDQPLDETSIHPEYYAVAVKLLEQIGQPLANWQRPAPAEAAPFADAPTDSASTEAVAAEAIPARSAYEGSSPSGAPQSPDSPAPHNAALVSDGATLETVTADSVPAGTVPGGETGTIGADEQSGTTALHSMAAQPVMAVAPPAPARPAFALDAEATGALSRMDVAALAHEHGVGEMMMRDIIDNLCRPRRDPRLALPAPVFRSGILGFEDLKPEMQLTAQVINVVDFGVFVDVGLGHTCLVHVSELSRGFIRDLYHSFAVGDVLTTWVREIDTARRRVKLSALPPGTQRFERHPGRGRQDRHGQRGGSVEGPAGGEGSTDGSVERPPRRDGAPGRRYGEGRPGGARPAAAHSGPSGGQPGGSRQGPPGDNSRPRFERGSRPPRRGDQRRGEQQQRTYERKPAKPKFVKPIDQEMLRGEKPMRSFSDLAQFFEKKDDEPETPPE